jgi:hypothetical protein
MSASLPLAEFREIVLVSNPVKLSEVFAMAVAPMSGVGQEVNEIAFVIPLVVIAAKHLGTTCRTFIVLGFHGVSSFHKKGAGASMRPPGW